MGELDEVKDMKETIQKVSFDFDRARLLVVSDTHGYIDKRIAELSNTCDIAIHAGDILAPLDLVQLKPKSGKIYAVRGNNDLILNSEESLDLPDQFLLSLPGGKLCVEHGHRIWDTKNYHHRLRQKHQQHEARAIVYGHTHRLVCDKDKRPWVLNPGAAGKVRTYGGPSCLILTVCKNRWQVKPLRFESMKLH